MCNQEIINKTVGYRWRIEHTFGEASNRHTFEIAGNNEQFEAALMEFKEALGEIRTMAAGNGDMRT